jgi:hypothetical protein
VHDDLRRADLALGGHRQDVSMVPATGSGTAECKHGDYRQEHQKDSNESLHAWLPLSHIDERREPPVLTAGY